VRERGNQSAEEVFSTVQEYSGEEMDTYLSLLEPRAEELESQALMDPGIITAEEKGALDWILRSLRKGRQATSRRDEPPAGAPEPAEAEATLRTTTGFLGGLMQSRPKGSYRDTRPTIPGAPTPAPTHSPRTPGTWRAGAGEEGETGGSMLNDRSTRLLVQHLNLNNRLDTDDAKNMEGTLGYLKKTEPRLAVYVARGCNEYQVQL